MNNKHDGKKKELIEEYIETGKQEDKIDEEIENLEDENKSNDEIEEGDPKETDSDNSADSEDDSEQDENDEQDESENNEQDESENDEQNEDENDEQNEDENDEQNEEENDEQDEDENDEQDEDENDEQENKNESKDDNKDKDSENKVDSESRRKLGPNNEKRKVNLDNYKKPPSIADRGSDYLKGKAGDAKANLVKNIQRVQAAASAAFSAIKGVVVGIVKLLVNPVFWIVLGVSLIIALVFFLVASTSAVFGGNDYNKLCDENGVGGVMVDDDVDDFTRQSAIASWLMSTPFEVNGGEPFSREQAMGIMGNYLEETGGLEKGANPKSIQGGYKNWETCDNDCVGAFVGGGKAVGLAQWDGQDSDRRRDDLVKLAREEGTEWYDLNTQLKHIKMEFDAEGDHTYENYMMKKSGFLDKGKTIEEYTEIFAKNIERCGRCRMDERKATAKAFDSKFNGASASLSSQCSGGLAMSSNVTELAAQIAWTREDKAARKGYGSCGANPGCGETFSKPEYVELKAKVEEETGRNGNNIRGLLASCDALVATLVRGSGIDTNIPYHNTDAQVAYLDNPKNGWERVSCQTRQPGDVFGKSGHIMIYVGEIDGKDTMVSASINRGGVEGRSAHMSNISCNGDKFYGDGMSVQGWRKVK